MSIQEVHSSNKLKIGPTNINGIIGITTTMVNLSHLVKIHLIKELLSMCNNANNNHGVPTTLSNKCAIVQRIFFQM